MPSYARLIVGVLAVLAALFAVPAEARASVLKDEDDLYRLPDQFLVGAGSASYQIEGAWNVSDKGLSTTDVAYGARANGGGNVACDSYHKYREDIAMLKLMGATHYRFSIAWARLLPTGESSSESEDGKRYYNAILDELERNGIEPVVTLWHVDMPAVLEQRFGGWQSEQVVDYFVAYATTAFRLFGERVRFWTTLNEPHMFCEYGAGHGLMGATRLEQGHSEYRCGHYMLLAHAKAYHAYKTQFPNLQGRVGITVENYFTIPCSTDSADVQAAERHQLFEVGWFLDPILGGRGDYPPVMRQRVGERLPSFTAEQKELLRDSLDFIGLNSYYGWSACDGVPTNAADPSYERDQGVIIPESSNMNSPPGAFQWSPWSIRASLVWLRDRYNPSIPFIITENGYSQSAGEDLEDTNRIAFISAWMRQILLAIHKDKVNVIGYFVWSLLDDFEWGGGYDRKLGLVHVDFSSTNLTRTPKASLHFMKDIITNRVVPERLRSSSSLPHGSPLLLVLIYLSTLIIK